MGPFNFLPSSDPLYSKAVHIIFLSVAPFPIANGTAMLGRGCVLRVMPPPSYNDFCGKFEKKMDKIMYFFHLFLSCLSLSLSLPLSLSSPVSLLSCLYL